MGSIWTFSTKDRNKWHETLHIWHLEVHNGPLDNWGLTLQGRGVSYTYGHVHNLCGPHQVQIFNFIYLWVETIYHTLFWVKEGKYIHTHTHTRTWYQWLNYNENICIKGHSCYIFELKIFTTSRYSTDSKVHLTNKLILDKVTFDIIRWHRKFCNTNTHFCA
jgi:hypothetical protein